MGDPLEPEEMSMPDASDSYADYRGIGALYFCAPIIAYQLHINTLAYLNGMAVLCGATIITLHILRA